VRDEGAAHLGLPCRLGLGVQSEFPEPPVHINTELLDWEALGWNQVMGRIRIALRYVLGGQGINGRTTAGKQLVIVAWLMLFVLVGRINLAAREAVARDGAEIARGNEQAPPEIWFAPLDPFRRPEVGYGGSVDFMQLFEPDAPWANAASYIQVFKLYPQFMRAAADADLAKIFKWLDQHRIALALEAALLHTQANCLRTEGFDEGQQSMAQRIRRLGGNLRYVMADEPLFFGHSYELAGTCRIPIPTLAQHTAAVARDFQQVFPQVLIVDAEPISNFKIADWIGEIRQFLSGFHEAYGQPFAAMGFEVGWWEPSWRERALAITRELQHIGEPVAVIYNGNPGDNSDAAWLRSAREHYRAYEALVGSPPNKVIFQSWVAHPTHLLPETSEAAFTSLILEYGRSH
jgi:hypothetical protein